MTDSTTFALGVLGGMLEEAREAAGYTVAQAANELNVVHSTLRRWERGIVAPSRADVSYLAGLYKVGQDEAKVWGGLTARGKERGLFEGSNVPVNMKSLLRAEFRTAKLRALELEYIPGLLQTQAYHRAIQSVELPVDSAIATAVRELRIQRRSAIFNRKPMPHLEFFVGPAAMYYLKTWPDIEAEQLAHLRELADLPTVDIRVITGPHAGMLGSFTLLTPPRSSLGRSVVCLESQDGIRYVEDPDVVSDYSTTLDAVRMKSKPIKEYSNDNARSVA